MGWPIYIFYQYQSKLNQRLELTHFFLYRIYCLKFRNNCSRYRRPKPKIYLLIFFWRSASDFAYLEEARVRAIRIFQAAPSCLVPTPPFRIWNTCRLVTDMTEHRETYRTYSWAESNKIRSNVLLNFFPSY